MEARYGVYVAKSKNGAEVSTIDTTGYSTPENICLSIFVMRVGRFLPVPRDKNQILPKYNFEKVAGPV